MSLLRQLHRAVPKSLFRARYISSSLPCRKDPWPLPHSPEHLASTATPTDEFIQAIVDLRRAEMDIRENTPSPLLNSRSVQDAAGGQMFPALNSIIRVRFICAACCDLVV